MAVTAAQVRPLEGSLTRPMQAGGTLNMGDAAYIASDGDMEQARANAAVSSEVMGLVVAVNEPGETAAADQDAVAICTFGPVGGFASLTPGKLQYLSSATAGALTETKPTGAGTWSKAVGYAESASVVFVMPGIEAATSNT